MAGALKTLYGALQASTFMTGVSFRYGEEYINAQDGTLVPPYVVMVPLGGPIETPGYALNLDPAVDMIWGVRHSIDFYLWGASVTNGVPSQNPIDHADAVESVRQQLLSALRDQQAQYVDVNSVSYGVSWKAVSERWLLDENALNRYGRCLIVSTICELSIPMPTPPEATIATVAVSGTI